MHKCVYHLERIRFHLRLTSVGGIPFKLEKRLEFLGGYKFHLVTEFASENDWIEPEFSQAFLAGTIPV